MSISAVQPAPASFANLMEVCRFLKAQGYKVGKSAIYNHRDQGLIRQSKDRTYALKEVMRYVKRAGLTRITAPASLQEDGAGSGGDAGAGPAAQVPRQAPSLLELEDMQRIKLKEEILKLRADRLRKELLLEAEQGKWVPRGDVEREIIARAVALQNCLRQQIFVSAPDIIFAAGGSQGRIRDVIEALEGWVSDALDRYASLDRFEVLVMPDGGKKGPGGEGKGSGAAATGDKEA